MYGLSNGENIFDLRWPLKVEDQGRIPKTLKSNISKTGRDREKVSIEIRYEIMYDVWAFEWWKYFWPQVTWISQKSRSNPLNFEVEYIENGTR